MAGTLILLTLLLLWSHGSTRADTGGDWLAAQAQVDGSYAGSAELATPFQATAETLRTFYRRGETSQPGIPLARQFLENDTYSSTEYFSRLVLMKADAGFGVADAVDALIANANADGGFGELAGYDSTALDTAFALDALNASGYGNHEAASRALGFLLAAQGADGGWGEGDNASSVYVTALALQALAPSRTSVQNVAGAVTSARNFLFGKRDADGLWGENFLSALSLIALINSLDSPDSLLESVAELRVRQNTDGSWDQDIYSTALALRALQTSGVPPNNPALASITGTVVDGLTSLPLSGVSVALTGPTPGMQATGVDGRFSFSNLAAGDYAIETMLNGYAMITGGTLAQPGQTVDFGVLRLLPESDNDAATVRGTITDAETGLPVSDVTVSLSGIFTASTTTGNDGTYQFVNLPPGSVTIEATKAGYSSATGNATLTAGGIFVFSAAISPAAVAQTAVRGTVTDGLTGAPLAGAGIFVTGANVTQTSTDSQGHYEIAGLDAGDITLVVSLAGYDSAVATAKLFENNILIYSPALFPENTTPPGSNSAGLTGAVLDAATDEPLADVDVQATFGSETFQLVTDANGTFSLEGLTWFEGVLRFTREGYLGAEFGVMLTPLKTLDLGQVRLRPVDTLALLPDLTLEVVDAAQALSDPATLEVHGTITVRVSNSGTAAAGAAELLAFYDGDKDGKYTPVIDTPLGQTSTNGDLEVQEALSIAIAVQGPLPYRDAPISVWVDSGQSVIESLENNNMASSATQCRIEPLPAGSLEPVEKWHWSGSAISPSFNQVMSTPLVAQLNDDNGDGRVDVDDVPDIVFTAFSGSNYTGAGVLRAVSGADGKDIWNVAPASTAMTAPAIGDIDHDGLVEIVVGGPNRNGLRVYENDGTLKWQVVVSGQAHPAIADIDNDGNPEIIYGRRVYNADGTLRWGFSIDDTIPLVVDLDFDGDMEIISNGIAYDHTGAVLWDSGYRGVFGAVGNFDDDDFPEIAVRTSSSITLLEHTGALKWGPVPLPGGGVGGPLTVADVDGDGEPEIGIAGARNYAVIETDGSIKWTMPTRDFSSSQTGSSVFDFEGDGRAEVLYNDELKFRIYDGQTGAVLFETPNSSGTLWEYPVVADIDKDGHAEIVLAANNYAFAGKTGIRVFEHVGDLWSPTRSIWNQHAYHIDNVDEDGAIPQFEAPSWLSHNTYRLNTFPGRDPLSSPDLTVSLLRVQQLTGGGFTFSARIGNGGGTSSPFAVAVEFYEGDPAADGVPIGSVKAAALNADAYQDITLESVPNLTGTQPIFAIIDPENRIAECNELNNQTQLPVPDSTLGTIQVSSDAAFYGPQQPVSFQAFVVNAGSLSGRFHAELRLEDATGITVAAFTPHDLGVISGGETMAYSENWNTADTLAGTYVLRGILRGQDGQVQDEDSATFLIGHPAAEGSVIDARVVTDKPVYAAWDQVLIEGRVANVSENVIQPPTQGVLTVADPNGTVIYTGHGDVGELVPGALRDLGFSLTLADAPAGLYTVTWEVLDAFSHALLATRMTSFTVERQAVQGLAGRVDAVPAQVYKGDPVVCTEQVTNLGASGLAGVDLVSQLIRVEDARIIDTHSRIVKLTGGGTLSESREIATADLEIGEYACVLTAEIEGISRQIGAAIFAVLEPPIRIEGRLSAGDRGRVLVLLDEAPKQCNGITRLGLEGAIDPPLGPDMPLDVELYDAAGNLIDHESGRADDRLIDTNPGGGANLVLDDIAPSHVAVSLSAANALGAGYRVAASGGDAVMLDSGLIGTDCAEALAVEDIAGDLRVTDLQRPPAANDPLGPNHLPDLNTQRMVLETLLTEAGWSYTLVTDQDGFARELRTGGYLAYLLLSEQVKLDEGVQKELREAVYRGEGLVEAGGHDQRQGRIDEALGVKFLGKHAQMTGLALADSPVAPAGDAQFQLFDRSLRASLAGAAAIGYFSADGTVTAEPAVTAYDYGLGRTVYAGIDLLAEASLPGADGLYGALLLDALAYVHPQDLTPWAEGVYPVRVSLSNEGLATPGRIVLTLPEGVGVVDAGGAEASGNTLVWPFDLPESGHLTFNAWLKLPAAPVTITALIQSGVAPDWADQGTLTLELVPEPLITVEDVYALAAPITDKAYKQAQKYLDWAQGDSAAGDWPAALASLLRAADALIPIATPQSAALREAVARAIRTVSIQIE